MLNKVFKLPVVGKVLKRTVSGKRWLFKVTCLLNATRPITAKIPKSNPPFTITYHAPLVEAVAVDLGGEILPGCTTVQLLSAFLDEHLPPTLESDDAPGAAPAPAARSTVQAMKRKAVVLEDDMSPGGKPMSRKYSQMKTLKLLCNQDKQIQRVLPLDDSMSVAAQQEA